MNIGDNKIIIGKRVSVGVAIGGIAALFGNIFPEYAPAILSGVVPLTFFVQLLIVRYTGVTT